ncbi:GAR domain-containing protein [Salix suchowensis]|nr:GAR domain-containing protein [Salix suchowensis]
MSLDERVDAVSKGIKSVNESLEPWLQSTATPTLAQNGDTRNENANAIILRKHATLMQDWDAVQDESEVLREELKEDKWLTVFRTVTDQADGMMSSLEKAVNRCQVTGVVLTTPLLCPSGATNRQRQSASMFIPLCLIRMKQRRRCPRPSHENGETLRRHAESAQRWKNLRDRISRTDAEMESVCGLLLNGDSAPSEGGSSTSGHTTHSRGGYLATPPSASRASRAPVHQALQFHISLRRFARKITGSSKQSPSTPSPLNVEKTLRGPASEPIKVIRRQRTSIFGVRGNQPATPLRQIGPTTNIVTHYQGTSSSSSSKQRWNSSTKIESEEKGATVKGTHQKRPPSATGYYARTRAMKYRQFPFGASYRRSLSRASMSPRGHGPNDCIESNFSVFAPTITNFPTAISRTDTFQQCWARHAWPFCHDT